MASKATGKILYDDSVGYEMCVAKLHEKANNMMLDEHNCGDKINALTYEDWQPLLALIPEIEHTTNYGQWSGGDKDEEGVVQLPYCVPSPIVSTFSQIVYDIPIIIEFRWGEWDEGRKIAGDKNFDFDATDLLVKCKLITAIVRNDRFCEGALVAAFKSGLILRLLKSIEKDVSAKRH